MLLTDQELSAPQIHHADKYFVPLADENLTRSDQSFLRIFILQLLEQSNRLTRQALRFFVSVAEPVECLIGPRGHPFGIVEEVQFQIDFRAIHIAQSDAAGIA